MRLTVKVTAQSGATITTNAATMANTLDPNLNNNQAAASVKGAIDLRRNRGDESTRECYFVSSVEKVIDRWPGFGFVRGSRSMSSISSSLSESRFILRARPCISDSARRLTS